MNSNRIRTLIILTALALITVSVLIAPAGELPFQTIFVFCVVAAAVLIASLLPITRRQLMKGYVIIGGVMLICAAFLAILFYALEVSRANSQIYEIGMSGLLTGGLVLVLIGGLKLRKSQDFEIQDERTKRIGAWGITYSWYLTYLFIVFALFAHALGLPIPGTDILLWLLIIIMPISAYLFQSYFYCKGDIE